MRFVSLLAGLVPLSARCLATDAGYSASEIGHGAPTGNSTSVSVFEQFAVNISCIISSALVGLVLSIGGLTYSLAPSRPPFLPTSLSLIDFPLKSIPSSRLPRERCRYVLGLLHLVRFPDLNRIFFLLVFLSLQCKSRGRMAPAIAYNQHARL